MNYQLQHLTLNYAHLRINNKHSSEALSILYKRSFQKVNAKKYGFLISVTEKFLVLPVQCSVFSFLGNFASSDIGYRSDLTSNTSEYVNVMSNMLDIMNKTEYELPNTSAPTSVFNKFCSSFM